MSIWDMLLKAKRDVRARIENALGRGTVKDLAAMRKDILNHVESKIVDGADGKSFPFGKVVLRLNPRTKLQRSALEEAFLPEGALKSDILQMLDRAQARYSSELETLVEFREQSESRQADNPLRPVFEMEFVKLNALRKLDVPQTKFVVTQGIAERSEYLLKKDRILIGRSPEVLDREGRMVRKNDVVFLENEKEVNSSVGRAHARIWFDQENSGFCILDEASRYGTRILRGGTVVEVPSGTSEGIRLQSGDDIYCGQACLRFLLI